MKILVVDDIEENIYLLKTILGANGYKVVTAKNGFEALNKLKKEPVDIIISDILMPKMDGFQFCRACKKDERFKDIPFMFYTATYIEKKDEEFALGLGADRFIIKPQKPDEFLRILKELIKEHKVKPILKPEIKPESEIKYLSGYSKRIVRKLEKKVLDLNKEINIRKQAESNLNKRLKELDCLQNISNLVNKPGASVEQIFKKVTDIIPKAYQYPDIAYCRVVFNKQEFKAEDFKKTKWMQAEDIKIKGEKVGILEVYYIEEKPDIFEGPFLKEERNMIKSISEIINIFLERKRADEKQKESYFKLEKTFNDVIDAMASMLENKDPYTAEHQKRVKALAVAIAKELGLDDDKIKAISTASMVHDIGKINVPTSILSKPGEISYIEFEIIKSHPETGYNILKEIEFTHPIAEIVLQHHERLNGSGYPKGIKNKEILFETKIISVADVVEAMSSFRPYRVAVGIKKALEEIRKNKNILYDSSIVNACINLFEKRKFKF